MWARATRGRMARIEKKTKRYPSDLTDEEWSAIGPVLPMHFPPWQTVYWWFRRFIRLLLFRPSTTSR